MGSGFSKYDRGKTNHSYYCYPGTDVLINNVDIKNSITLAEYEADVTALRQSELVKESVVKGKFGITHLKRIHRYIFQDIYPFAGKFRVEDISKESTTFCKSEFIEPNLDSLLQKLGKDNYLRNLSVEQFAEKAAYYLSEINMIHPFREGNGRCIREFIRQLGMNSGYILNWSLIDNDTLLKATIIAVDKDYGPLSACIIEVIENK